jgi:WD40 repeat protein
MAFSADAALVAACRNDFSITIWSADTGQEVATLSTDTTSPTRVVFAPLGSILASGTAAGSIRLWDAATRSDKAALEGHRGAIVALEFAPDGKSLASACTGGIVNIWRVSDGARRRLRSGGSAAALSLAFSPDGSLLALGTFGEGVVVWDLPSDRPRAKFADNQPIARCAFSHDGRSITGLRADGAVVRWDCGSGLKQILQRRTPPSSHCMTVSANGRFVAASDDSVLNVWDLDRPPRPRTLASDPR